MQPRTFKMVVICVAAIVVCVSVFVMTRSASKAAQDDQSTTRQAGRTRRVRIAEPEDDDEIGGVHATEMQQEFVERAQKRSGSGNGFRQSELFQRMAQDAHTMIAVADSASGWAQTQEVMPR